MILQEGFSAFKEIQIHCKKFPLCISANGHLFRTVSPQAGGNSSFQHNLTEATIGKQIIKAPFSHLVLDLHVRTLLFPPAKLFWRRQICLPKSQGKLRFVHSFQIFKKALLCHERKINCYNFLTMHTRVFQINQIQEKQTNYNIHAHVCGLDKHANSRKQYGIYSHYFLLQSS